MNIFIYHLHGDTLFTAFFLYPTSKLGYDYTSINIKSTFTIAKPKNALFAQDFTFKECQPYSGSKV